MSEMNEMNELEEFKAQIADPNFEGYCHCLLYYKEKQFLKMSGDDG